MKNDIFLDKMKGVKPLNKKKNKIKNKKNNKSTKIISKTIEKPIFEKTNLENIDKKKEPLNLSFNNINRDLKRGKIKIDRRLDLHGYKLHEAHEKFKNEVIKTYDKNKRYILVITGKGTHLKDNDNDLFPKLFHGKIKNEKR